MDRLWSREEILNMVEKYGSTHETITLLWTNSDMTSEFPSTQINLLDLTKYTKLIIFYKNYKGGNAYCSSTIYLNNGNTVLRNLKNELFYFIGSIYYRDISVAPITMGTIIFGNCIENDLTNKTSETNNAYLIPCYICGVN